MYQLKIVYKKPSGVNEGNSRDDLPVHIVTRPEDLMPVFETIRDADQEHFLSVTLNGAGKIINSRVITIGLLNHSLVHPREVFRPAISDNAASIIVCHNHPSGSLEPSPQDIAITNQLKDAGTLIGIQVLDHIIVAPGDLINGAGRYVSMREKGLM